MESQKVRLGFLGAGKMGQCAHLRNYAAIDECEVTALAECRKDTARKVADAYGIPNVYTDHREMLAKENLDGVVAIQPFDRHGILVPELRNHGLPVFTEKPLAYAIETGKKICEADKANKGFLMIGYHKLSDPATIHAKTTIDSLTRSGEIGDMTYVRLTMPPGNFVAGGFNCLIQGDDFQPEFDHDPPPTDMDAETQQTYRKFVNYYIHQVNLMRHLLGEDYKLTSTDTSAKLVAGESDSGTSSIIEMAPYKTSVDWQEEALVCFERGWIKLALPAPLAFNRAGEVEVFKDPGNGEVPVFTNPQMPNVHAMRQQALNFIAAIRGDYAFLCDAETGLKDLETAREYVRLVHQV